MTILVSSLVAAVVAAVVAALDIEVVVWYI